MSDSKARIEPVAPGEAQESDINDLLRNTVAGWWQDSRMWGVIAHVPEALRGWMHLIVGTGTAVDPVTWELMALRGAYVTGCHY